MINYPNKKKIYSDNNQKKDTNKSKNENLVSAANRGMDFEHAVNLTCSYYSSENIALFSKRPTPIKIVKTDYKLCKITEAYFEKQSNTDYNGVYKGNYIDFECKETRSTTSLSFNNIPRHQINHLKKVIFHGGISFFLVYFYSLNEIYLVDARIIIEEYEKEAKKSITYQKIKEVGIYVEQGFLPRLHLIEAIDKLLNI